MNRLVLDAIAWHLGTPTDIALLPEVRREHGLETTLRGLGIETYSASDESLGELARRSCLHSIDASGLRGADIDGFVVATNGTLKPDGEGGMRELHASLGLDRAVPTGVFGADCANVPLALQVAHDMLEARGGRQVLVVTTDRAVSARRVMDGFVGVLGDGAASCVLSKDGERGFSVESIALHAATAMAGLNARTSALAYLKGMMNGAVESARRCLVTVGIPMRTVKFVVMANFNKSVRHTYANQLDLRHDQLVEDGGAKHGHVWSADLLVNVATLARSGRLNPDDYCLVVGTGPGVWGSMLLRALDRPS